MSTYYNTLIHPYSNLFYDNNTNNNQALLLNCSNHLIGKFIYGIGYKLSNYNDLNQLKNKMFMNITELEILNFTEYPPTEVLYEEEINNYNNIFKECFLKNNCQQNITNNSSELSNVYLLYYECIDNNAFPKNYSQNLLKIIFNSVTIITLILILFLYVFYKKVISQDNKDYKKDKIIINNYTLILHDLDFNSNDYYLELNDLIFFLNNIIYNEIKNNDLLNAEEIDVSSKNEIDKNFYIFDISISNVNNKKIEKFKKIKSIQNKITNIKNDNYSIKQKIKNNMREAYNSVHTLYINLTDKNDDDNNEKSKDNLGLLLPLDQDLYEENKIKKDKKLKTIKDDLKEIMNNITDEISELHAESKHKKYVDIYLTFKNPSISNLLYKIYKKNKIKRFFYYLCCCTRKIKKYYFKNKWLYFEISNTAPNDIQWENCYIFTSTKKKKRCISFLVSSFIIISVSISFLFLKNKTKDNNFLYMIILYICQIVNLFSSILLEKLTKSEKYSTLTKNISSNITKYFWLNFIITGFSINIHMPSFNIFTYSNLNDYFEVINCILITMLISIFSENGVVLFKYLWNLVKRFIDSNFENGKKTKIKYKSKYDELYIGPEFPIDERYSSIYVYLSICLLYGSYCPLIYIFFTLFLITTFIVDKYLIINFYKKPPYYDNYLSKLTSKFLLLGVFIFFFGLIYNISIPYLFNYIQNNDYINYKAYQILYIMWSPLSLINFIISKNSKMPITIFNISTTSYIYIIFYSIFIYASFIFMLFKLCKKRKNFFLSHAPNINIGDIYSLEQLNKYYEIKKLELFKFLISYDKKGKILYNYNSLIKNYKNVIDYLKKNIDYRKTNDINKDKTNEGRILEDISYNLSFIPNYELYNNFDLLNNI